MLVGKDYLKAWSSDHGTAFLSKLLAEVHVLMGMKKLNQDH